MRITGHSQAVFKANTQFSPLFEPIKVGYLGSSDDGQQPFCKDAEGWGPLSPIRYDFTPCFLDVWISSVAVFGLLFGAGAIVYLLRWRPPQPVRKNWHLYLKLVSKLSVHNMWIFFPVQRLI